MILNEGKMMRIFGFFRNAILCVMSVLLLSGCGGEVPVQPSEKTTTAAPVTQTDTVPETEVETQPLPLEDVLEIYPIPACYEESEQVTATVNGEKLPVIRCHDEYDYCSFAFRGEVTLTIDAGEGVKSVSVSPLAKEIPCEKNGKTVTITMTRPEYLIVKINNKREIVIAADPPEMDVPASSGEGIWNVVELGADCSGKASATRIIQDAVDAASAAQGGVVYVPAGIYSIGNLNLRSNVRLYLEPGAVLRADRTDEFKSFCTRTVGDTAFPSTYLLYTEPGCENITIDGRGTIDCRGFHYYQQKNWLVFGFVPNKCDNLKLDGVIVRDTGHWGTVIAYCRDVSITNTKHFNKPSTLGQNDGIDICGSQDVLVSRTIALCRDDPYSIKTYVTNYMFEGVGRAAENVVFEDCFAWTRCAAFKLGWGISMGMTDIVFRNSYVYNCNIGLGVTHYGGSAGIKNVTFENIDIEKFQLADSRWLLAAIDTSKPGGNRTEWGSVTGLTIRDINVRSKWAGQNVLKGHDKKNRITDVEISGITLLGKACSTLAEMDVETNEFVADVRIIAPAP